MAPWKVSYLRKHKKRLPSTRKHSPTRRHGCSDSSSMTFSNIPLILDISKGPWVHEHENNSGEHSEIFLHNWVTFWRRDSKNSEKHSGTIKTVNIGIVVVTVTLFRATAWWGLRYWHCVNKGHSVDSELVRCAAECFTCLFFSFLVMVMFFCLAVYILSINLFGQKYTSVAELTGS